MSRNEKWTIGLLAAAAVIYLLQWHVLQDTEQRQVRAYLRLIPAEFVLGPTKDLTELRVGAINFGRTPAFAVQIQGHVRPYPYPFDMKVLSPYFDSLLRHHFAFEPTGISVPPLPNMAQNIAHYGGVTVEDVNGQRLLPPLTAPPGMRIYAYGTVHYWDVFRKEHYTNFCVNYPNAPTLNNQNLPIEYCPEHNDADLDLGYFIGILAWLPWPDAQTWQAIATIALAVLAIFQLRWLRQQSRNTEQAASAAERGVTLAADWLETSFLC